MSTEEDTFRFLARTPLLEMIHLWQTSPIPACDLFPDAKPEDVRHDVREFFRSHGWEYLNFNKAWSNYIRSRDIHDRR